jgi:diacylglycerol kinase family enzyme
VFAVLLNPASGAVASNGGRERIEELFREHGRSVHIYEVQTADALTRAGREALEGGHEAIVAAGGDGTVNAVATLVAGRPIPLGVLPLGTLNHFAKDLGIPVALDKAVETIVQGHIARVDAGRVSDRIFLNNCSIGIYPDIVERREALRKLGRRKWIAFLLATREVLQRGDEVLVRLASGPQMISAQTPFLFVGNNEYLSEGIKIGARRRLDAGRLCA